MKPHIHMLAMQYATTHPTQDLTLVTPPPMIVRKSALVNGDYISILPGPSFREN